MSLVRDALALIDEQQAQIENLKKENKYLRERLAEEMEHKEDMAVFELKAEIMKHICIANVITPEMMDELRMAHTEEGQHGDPVGERGECGLKHTARYVDMEDIITKLDNDTTDPNEMFPIHWVKTWLNMQPTANVAPIADTVKKMQERLKEAVKDIPWCEYLPVHNCIDQIAKEILEGDPS